MNFMDRVSLWSLVASVVLVLSLGLARPAKSEGNELEAAALSLLRKEREKLGGSIRVLGLGPQESPGSFCSSWIAASEDAKGEIIDSAVDLVLTVTPEQRALRPCVKVQLRAAHPHINRACTQNSEYAMPTPSDFMALVRLGATAERNYALCKLGRELRRDTP